MTWLDLIKSSLRMIQASGPGRSIGTAQIPDALIVLNAMLDGANADRLNIYTVASATHPLTAGKGSYTIGTGGDFDTARPQEIETANLILSGNLRQPLKLLNDQQYAGIKLLNTQSTIPQFLYNDGNYPQSTLYLWPIPSAAHQLELWTWQMLTSVSNTGDTVSLPPGYADWLRYKLAVRLALEWGKELRPEVVELAREAETKIQRANLPAPVMACDAAVLGGRGGAFNWLTGEIG